MPERRSLFRTTPTRFESPPALPTEAPASPRPESVGASPRRARSFGRYRRRKGWGIPAGKRLARAALCALALPGVAAAGAVPEVVVSIKPIHSLVAGVMGEAGEPRLIVHGAASPHTYQMRPSEAAALHAADLVVWVGEDLELFLSDPIADLGSGAEILTLHQVPGIRLLPNRSGGVWGASHDHGHEDDHAAGHDEEHEDDHAAGHDGDHEDDHAAGHDGEHEDDHAAGHDGEHEDDHAAGHDGEHEDDHAAGHDEEHEDDHAAGHDGEHEDDHAAGHDEEHEDDHAHGEIDMHIWFDPHNARRIVDVVAASLARLDPERAATYRRNAAAMGERITALEKSLQVQLAPVRSRAFVVFHDAYQYLERAFGLRGAAGAVTLGPDRLPGAKRLASLRRVLVEREVRCLFIEPQFEPRLALALVDATEVRIGTLDPLGADLAAGPDAWFDLLRRMGDSLAGCLGDA